MQKVKAVLLHPRLQSLYWRTGMMALAYFLSGVAENLALFDLSPDMTVMAGLILGEVSKQLNKMAQERLAK